MVARTGPPLVLVVEHYAAIRELYRDVLEEEGFRVVAWSAPPAELTSVKILAPDLVILNLLFNQDDLVWQFLEALKADTAIAMIPVLVCATNAALLERLADRLASWACGVFLKPFDLEPFLIRVRACLGEGPGPGPD